MWDMEPLKNTIREENIIPHSSSIEKKDSKIIADKYLRDPWWINIYLYITDRVYPKDSKVNLKLFSAAVLNSALKKIICFSKLAANPTLRDVFVSQKSPHFYGMYTMSRVIGQLSKLLNS